ncbi:MAG: bifunctional heptose 7-phosphate kinase/heptose 1-phosphate adenyltransferase [Armatimonadota bacterium]
MMTQSRLAELTSQFKNRRIAVMGDFFLDKYLECDPSLAETSLETGKTAHQVVQVRHSPGAAGNIVSNLISLGASVYAVGFTGDDGEGYELRQDLSAMGCDTRYLLTEPSRHTPVYLKPRVFGISGLEGERERYDTKNHAPLPTELEDQFIALLPELLSQVDAVIIADQVNEPDFGVVTSRVRMSIEQAAAAHPERLFWVDSRERAGMFLGCTLKPNRQEAILGAFGTSEPNASEHKALAAGQLLHDRTGKPVFLTLSEQGIMIFDHDAHESVPGIHIEGPTDPTGAGDSATAGAVLALASGASPAEAALLGNLTASITVCQIDTTGTARVSDLADRLTLWHQQHG